MNPLQVRSAKLRLCAILKNMPAYALTIFTGAFLLFQVQPLIGKYILPWFGGGPGVWTTCMLFFQALLVVGYAYAHLSSRWLKPRAQALLHVALVLAALALLPITPSGSWKPHGSGNPTCQILALLAANLGLPYFVLSSTGPLMQAWFCRTHSGVSPYRLYALSNAGSLLALVSFPFFFEAHFTRQAQARVWSWGLAAYGVCCGLCALRLWRGENVECQVSADGLGTRNTEHGTSNLPSSPSALRPSPITHALWLLLPACASVLLLATTNKICQDVAVVPFLWVLPLALYLLSFIICFDNPHWYVRLPFALALMAALAGVCWALFKGGDPSLYQQVAVYGGGLFVCCMVCHGELYRLRPDPSRLTAFYLSIAAGGAGGGLFVAVAAPMLFTNYYELHWGLFLCGLLFLVACVAGQRTQPPNVWRRLGLVWLSLAVIALSTALWLQARKAGSEAIIRSRNFYGVLTVYEHRRREPEGRHFLLQHGRITHGLQFVDPHQAARPTTYYGEESGIGLALRALPPGARRIGLVGLGTGTITAYAQPGDYLRIYEINPEVRRLAMSPFTYLQHCPGKVEVVLGDARLSLERESPQQFDLLALDAFSSDAIPVHLLTKEAFDLYGRHLKPNGLIAVHISNHYLDLEPVVVNLARYFNYKLTLVDYDEHENEDEWWVYSSTWMLLSHSEEILDSPAILQAAGLVHTNSAKIQVWTDEFTSLFQVLK